MNSYDAFEQRATSAGAALRRAFLDETSTATAQAGPALYAADAVTPTVPSDRRRPPRRVLAAAAALAVAAVAFGVGVVASSARTDDPADLLRPPAERENAVLTPPYLVGSGRLPDRPVQSVQDVPVPFTFSTPPQLEGMRHWQYWLAGGLFDLGNIVSGITVVAPTETYDPEVTWKGQDRLVPAPTDAAGWADWLEATGLVEVTERRQLLVGGAPATRFSLDLDDLPASYEGCGGGRTCLALMPMHDPQVGPPRAGVGAQAGIDDKTPQLTVVELEDRAVLVLTSGEPDRADEWLPTVQDLIASLRFA